MNGLGDDAEARERAAEVKDLTGRVVLGTALSLPVVAAVMLEEVFGVHWVPDALMNPWVQLVLITPVFGPPASGFGTHRMNEAAADACARGGSP